MSRNGENQSDQVSQVQARLGEQLRYSATDSMCGPTIHHRTLHPCQRLWAAEEEEELIGLYIMINAHIK